MLDENNLEMKLQTFQNDFYVDDGYTSLSTNKEAIDLIQTTEAMRERQCTST